jgi:hypothetical protein
MNLTSVFATLSRFFGWNSPHHATTPPEWMLDQKWRELRTGMSYDSVQRVLGPLDPHLKWDVSEVAVQERRSDGQHKSTMQRVHAVSAGALLAMRSTVEIHRRGYYALLFRNGRLVSWLRLRLGAG